MSVIVKGLKIVTGIQGAQDKKAAKILINEVETKLSKVKQIAEKEKVKVDKQLNKLASKKVKIINTTITPFIEYVNRINQRAKGSEYETIQGVEINSASLVPIDGEKVSMTDLARRLSTVTAVGAVVLGSTLYASTGFVFAGVLNSFSGKKKLKEAEEYAYEVEQKCIEYNNSILAMQTIVKSVAEHVVVMTQLKKRLDKRFKYFRPLLSDFNNLDDVHIESFRICAILCKGLSEIIKTPLIDEGQLSKTAILNLYKAKQLTGSNKEL